MVARSKSVSIIIRNGLPRYASHAASVRVWRCVAHFMDWLTHFMDWLSVAKFGHQAIPRLRHPRMASLGFIFQLLFDFGIVWLDHCSTANRFISARASSFKSKNRHGLIS